MQTPTSQPKARSPNQSKTQPSKNERRRLKKLVEFEITAKEQGFKRIAGVDEAGRGPLAGPVMAAACIIAEGVFFKGINDCKLILPQKREKLFQQIQSHPLVCFGIGQASVEEINEFNIFEATKIAMRRALDQLAEPPDLLLVDGLLLSYKEIRCEKIIEGDRRSQSIAAASILAKVTRDHWMMQAHAQYPQYGFNLHKGYGTEKHRKALKEFGPCPLHRNFKPIQELLGAFSNEEEALL